MGSQTKKGDIRSEEEIAAARVGRWGQGIDGLVTAVGSRPNSAPSDGTVGAMSELVVAVDLMKAGFHICRALSQHCPFDLVAANNEGRSCRIEVRTGSTKPNGKIQFAFAAREFALGRFDVLAIPVRGGGIHYEPSVADWFAGKRATVESLLAIRCAPRIGKDGRPLYLARIA